MRARLLQDHALLCPRPLLETLGDLHPAPQVRGGGVPARDPVQGQRQLRSKSPCGLGIDGDGVEVDVGDGVAGEMVAGICGSTGAGEDAARWDAEVEEADVVRPGSEGSSLSQSSILFASKRGTEQNLPKVCVLALGRKVCQQIIRGPTAVLILVDGKYRERRAYHVVVEVVLDLVDLLSWQVPRVVQTADQAALLGSPPREADLVLESGVLPHAVDNAQQARSPTAVVIDAGSSLHTIKMRTKDNHTIGVTLRGLAKHIPRLARLKDRVHKQRGADLFPSSQPRLPRLRGLERDQPGGHQRADVLGPQRGRREVGPRLRLVHERPDGARRLGEPELVGDGAHPALDEGHLAGGVDALPLVGKTARPPRVVDGGVDQGARDAVGHRGGGVVEQGEHVDVLAVGAGHGDLAGLLKCVVEGLHPRREGGGPVGGGGVCGAAYPLEDVVHAGLEAWQAEGSVAAVCVADVVEVCEDPLEPVAVVSALPAMCFRSLLLLGGGDVGLDQVGADCVCRQAS